MIQFATVAETVPATYTVDGHVFDAECPLLRADGKRFIPSSYIVYCSICGTVWAERKVHHEHAQRYWAKEKSCESCGHGFLWEWYDEGWNRSLPHQLLLREVEIITNLHEAGVKNYAAMFSYTKIRREI